MSRVHRKPSFAEEDQNDAIDRLYAELATLYAEKEAAPGDRGLGARIDETFRRLRSAQAEEVTRLRHTFESRLLMPLGEGRELLGQIRRMKGLDEDPAAGHPTSPATDRPET